MPATSSFLKPTCELMKVQRVSFPRTWCEGCLAPLKHNCPIKNLTMKGQYTLTPTRQGGVHDTKCATNHGLMS